MEPAGADNPDPATPECPFRRPTPAADEKPTASERVWPFERVRGSAEREVTRVAGCQRSRIHREQLIAAGFSRDAIAHRLRTGWLTRELPRVYCVGSPSREPLGRETAVVLYYDGHAVLSGGSSLGVWGVIPSPEIVAVTLLDHHRSARPGIAVHRTKALHPADLRVHQGLPVTAPARAIIDYAAGASAAELERAMAQARVQRLLTDSHLRAAIDRVPHRKGVAAVKAMLDAEHDPAFTRRELERRFLNLIRAAQLPSPRVNARLHGFEVDFLWPQQRLVVETDGGQFHNHPRAFETDRRRDQILVANGYRVIRVTWRQLRDEPLAVVARLTMALLATPT